jgi:hypothetical protein
MNRKDLKMGVKGPAPNPFRSRKTLRGRDGRLRRVIDERWVPAGTGLMQLRTDTYRMSTKISKDQQKVFERPGIRLGKGFRPYSHEISGIGKHGPIGKSETAHGIEAKRIPRDKLAKAARGKLPKGSDGYGRYFR